VHLSEALHEKYSSLGWFQMCLGRLSVLWAQSAQRYDTTFHPKHWASSVVQAMWLFTRAMWKHSNTIVHGDNMQAKSKLVLSELQTKVEAAYKKFEEEPSHILPRHHYLFTNLSIEQRLSQPYDNIQCWLRSITATELSLELHIRQQQRSASFFFLVDNTTSNDSTYEKSFCDDESSDTSLVSEDTVSTTTTDTTSLLSNSTSSMSTLLPLLSDKKP
jgi:hypothetical protein